MITKLEYLKNKKQRMAKRRTPRALCLKCTRPKTACFCDAVDSFETQTEFIILMHPMEAKRSQVGTGRIAKNALKNSRLIISEGFQNNVEVNKIINDSNNEVYLLYPGKDSLNISKKKLTHNESKKMILFILDSTWACSKKMLRLSPNLQKLPKISFEPNYLSRFAIKRQPKKYCLSTIESIYRVIQEFKKQGIEKSVTQEEVLPEALSQLVKFHKDCALNPDNKHYRGGTK